MYSSATVANYFLDKASAEARAITPMQLIKLVYIAHGWHLAYLDSPLIAEPVCAWKYGPVIESLYHDVKKYGSNAVTAKIPAMFFGSGAQIDETTASLLDAVWSTYARYSGIQLSAMTHQPGTPWDIAWKNGLGRKNVPISNDLIKQHYSELRHARQRQAS